MNEWQQLSRRTLSATLPARERARERERTEKRGSAGAVARALSEITTVLFSSDASRYLVYFTSGVGFFSSTHPLDPPCGNLYCVVVTQRLLLHEKERIEEKEREREAETDQIDSTDTEERGSRREEARLLQHFFYILILKRKRELTCMESFEALKPRSSKVRTANWRDSWWGLETSRTTLSSHNQQCSLRMRTSIVAIWSWWLFWMIMLDTNHCLSLEPSPPGSPPMGEDMEKAGLILDHERHVYHSLKEGGQAMTNKMSLHVGLLPLQRLCVSQLSSAFVNIIAKEPMNGF